MNLTNINFNHFQVPILATRRLASVYNYIDDDRVSIIRPQALRDVPALYALRTGRRPDVAQSVQHLASKKFRTAVDRMLLLGWRRSEKDFLAVKNAIWERNRKALLDILIAGEIPQAVQHIPFRR